MGWIKTKDGVPEYIQYRGMTVAPMVIIRFVGDKRWRADSGRPKGVDVGSFTVHTKEWRRQGCNYACKATHWMPMPIAPKQKARS